MRGEGNGAMHRAISLAEQGRIKASGLTTHHFPLDQVDAAFETYVNRRDGAIKVMLDVAGDEV